MSKVYIAPRDKKIDLTSENLEAELKQYEVDTNPDRQPNYEIDENGKKYYPITFNLTLKAPKK